MKWWILIALGVIALLLSPWSPLGAIDSLTRPKVYTGDNIVMADGINLGISGTPDKISFWVKLNGVIIMSGEDVIGPATNRYDATRISKTDVKLKAGDVLLMECSPPTPSGNPGTSACDGTLYVNGNPAFSGHLPADWTVQQSDIIGSSTPAPVNTISQPIHVDTISQLSPVRYIVDGILSFFNNIFSSLWGWWR